MKKTIMKKWVAALRSGEYEQTSGSLVSINNEGERFCCMGVLCNLATEDGYGEWDGYVFKDEKGLNSNSWLPPGVIKWAGMKSESGEFESSDKDCGVSPEGYSKTLVGLNDAHTPFTELADIIEANYKDL